MRLSKTSTIEAAMRAVARDCADEDRLTGAACIEAADRLAEMRELLEKVLAIAAWMPGAIPDDALIQKIKRAAK